MNRTKTSGITGLTNRFAVRGSPSQASPPTEIEYAKKTITVARASRYLVEGWLRETASEPSEITVLGLHSQNLPRGYGMRSLSTAAQRGIPFRRALDANLLVINEEEPMRRYLREFTARLVSGSLNYHLVLRHRYPPWPFRLNRDGILTNLRTVNQQITGLLRTAPWALSDEEVDQALLALRERRPGRSDRRRLGVNVKRAANRPLFSAGDEAAHD